MRTYGDGLKCPNCGSGKTLVNGTARIGGSLRRRRKCKDCHHGFNSVEKLEAEIEVLERSHAVIENAVRGVAAGGAAG